MLKVFITGASSGIGWALAEYYARQGAQLGLAARRAEPLQRLSARWPGQVRCYPLDVTDAASLRAAGADDAFQLHAEAPQPGDVLEHLLGAVVQRAVVVLEVAQVRLNGRRAG
jgi:NAD(P)-dependent dehydrogenase (short-subunit alcohol dehydrogenase family)